MGANYRDDKKEQQLYENVSSGCSVIGMVIQRLLTLVLRFGHAVCTPESANRHRDAHYHTTK